MKQRKALKLLSRLHTAIAAGAAHDAPTAAHCACGASTGTPVSTDATSMTHMLQRWAAAGMSPWPADAAAQRAHVGRALVQVAGALLDGVETLRGLDGHDPAQARLGHSLAATLERTAQILQNAAAWGWNDSPTALDEAGVRDAAASLRETARLLMASPALRHNGSAQAHAQALSGLGDAWIDLVSALAAQPGEAKLLGLCQAQCGTVGLSTLSLLSACGLFGTSAAVAQPALGCAGTCPHQGCTRYCHDAYSNPVGCTPWVRVPAGLFNAAGWSTTCTYTVRAEVKDVCCCYRSRWDRFWAVDACRCTTTTVVTGIRAAAYTWQLATRVPPAAPPTGFIVSTAC